MRSLQRHQLKTRPKLLWSLLLLLTWSQVAFAAHQFEHSASELNETCSVCVQFDRNDDVVACAEAEVLQAAGLQFAVAGETHALVSAQGFSHYRSRASP